MSPKQLKEYLDREYLKFKDEVLSGNYVQTERILFKDFAGQWEKDFASTLALTTYGNHQRKLELHINPVIGHMRMDQINQFHLMTVLREMKRFDGKDVPVTYHSKQDVYRTLKSIFKYAVKWGYYLQILWMVLKNLVLVIQMMWIKKCKFMKKMK